MKPFLLTEAGNNRYLHNSCLLDVIAEATSIVPIHMIVTVLQTTWVVYFETGWVLYNYTVRNK